MTTDTDISSTAPPDAAADSPPSPILAAALLSSVVPGAGQALLGQKPRAAVFIAGSVAFYLMYWPLRLPVDYRALLALPWIIFSLCLLSGCTALLGQRTQDRHPSKWWLLLCLLLAIVASWGHYTWALWASGFKPFSIPSRSMEYTVFVGDHVMADTRYYRNSPPAQGDVVIFRKENFFSIKRVIAVGGSTVQGRNGLVYVNGTQLNEPYAHHLPALRRFESWQTDFGPFTIPPGKLFVMGDNRDISLDSRSPDYGPVEIKDVKAKPLYVILYRRDKSVDTEPAIPEVTDRNGKEIR
jgi:signal peptidase I